MVAAAVVFLLVAGVAFANSMSVAKVTNNARSLHWTNAVSGTAALSRAGLAQAVTFAELADTESIGNDDLEFAMVQAHASAEELAYLLGVGENFDSYPMLARLVPAVTSAIATLENGDIDAAKTIVQTDVEMAYIALTESLMAEQATIQSAIDDNTSAGRQLNNWVVFVLTLLVPGTAIAVYFVVVRRQMRAYRERIMVELEAEREVSRAKDSFIAGLSHELRTPLTSIYGFAEVLSDGSVQGPEATQETAQVIASEAAEMTRMVDDLLTASRLESTGVEIDSAPTSVRDVIESAVGAFERAGHEIRRSGTAIALVDGARLRQVLVNLVSNAIRHGGSRVDIDVSEAEGVVSIEVSDDGPGVPEEMQGRLFERFAHSGDTPLLTGSVGLGLAVASRLASLMGGSIEYQRFGGRTYFIVNMPAVGVDYEAEADTESVASVIRAMSS